MVGGRGEARGPRGMPRGGGGGGGGGLAGRALALALAVAVLAALPRAAEVAQRLLVDGADVTPAGGGELAGGARAGVLGFALDRAGRPSPPLEARVREGVRLLRAGRVERLVFSGGHPGGGLRGGVSEAEVMKSFSEMAMGAPLPRGAAVLEDRSTSTRENALFSLVALAEGGGGGATGLGVGEVVVVTSGFHQWRARRVFLRAAKELNLPAQVTVAPLGPDSDFGFSRAFEQTLQRALRGETWGGARGWLMIPLVPAAAVLDACAALFHVAREILAILLYFSKGWIAL